MVIAYCRSARPRWLQQEKCFLQMRCIVMKGSFNSAAGFSTAFQ